LPNDKDHSFLCGKKVLGAVEKRRKKDGKKSIGRLGGKKFRSIRKEEPLLAWTLLLSVLFGRNPEGGCVP